MGESYKKSIENLNNQLMTIREQITLAIQPTRKMLEEFNQNLYKQIKPVYEVINRYQKLIQENTNIVKNSFDNMSKNQEQLATKMIQRGWYYSGILPLNTHEILSLDDEDFDLQLVSFYDEEYETLHNNIIRNFVDRKNILEKCFEAHENGDYELSIPAMLTQADGISKEIFDKQLFSKVKGKDVPVTKNQNKVDFNIDSWFDVAYYIQLSIVGQLNVNSDKTEGFNRHKVIHGLTVDYAIKQNSIKCIVILNFLAEIKEYFVDKDKKKNIINGV